MYCTVADVREVGVPDGTTDEQITVAIGRARELIDRYTGGVWAPTTIVVVARLQADGTALLPFRVRTVSSVVPVGSATAMPSGSYLVLSSEVHGQIDAVVFSAGGSNMLVAGAEPWNGGYAGLLGRAMSTPRLTVTGEFGTDAPPLEVAQGAAVLAAWLLEGGSLVGNPGAGSAEMDDEGNTVSITVDSTKGVPLSSTTGLAAVDAALAHLVRTSVMIS